MVPDPNDLVTQLHNRFQQIDLTRCFFQQPHCSKEIRGPLFMDVSAFDTRRDRFFQIYPGFGKQLIVIHRQRQQEKSARASNPLCRCQ